MSDKSIDLAELRSLIRELVTETIEGGDDSAIQDLIAHVALAAGVPYDAGECSVCGGLVDLATCLRGQGEDDCELHVCRICAAS